MFGLGKRVALIKELVEKRLVLQGRDSLDARLFVKSLGKFATMSLPEATIVTVLETALKAQKQGVPFNFALDRLEKQRRLHGSVPSVYNEILELSHQDAASALVAYCKYRIDYEAPPGTSLTSDEITELISIAYPVVSNW